MEEEYGWMTAFSAVGGRVARTIRPDANMIGGRRGPASQDGVLFTFRLSRCQNLRRSQHSGTINTSHGMIVTIALIIHAVLTAKSVPDSLKASPIGVQALLFVPLLSKAKVISTAAFSVSLASILRCAVSLSSCDCASVNCS